MYSPENDYYAVLGVPVGAEAKQISTVFRTLVKGFHPDKYKADNATEKMALINIAYETLKSPERRREYDGVRERYFLSGAWRKEPGARAKEALWNSQRLGLLAVMQNCKNTYFSGKATILENNLQLLIPHLELAEATLPNVVCQGDSEVIGIWCESDGANLIAAIGLNLERHVSIRRYIQPAIIADAINDCIAEGKVIKSLGQTP